MTNALLLRATMGRVELAVLESQWDQGVYRDECGTAYCFAGWCALVAGARFASDDPESDFYDQIEAQVGDPVHVSVWARNALGLSYKQAGELFNAHNDLEDLRGMVDLYCDAALLAAA